MTLFDVIRTIERIASAQSTINMIVENDPYKLNNEPSAEYGVFAFRQTEHTTTIESGIIYYGFELFYIDRLTNDRSNQIEVQSVGLQTLDNIVRGLPDTLLVSDYRFTPFYQKFADECTGTMCTLTIGAEVGTLCAIDSTEKNNIKTI